MNRPPRYRRFLLDMHIPDWDESLLASFDPREYAALLARARVDSAMVYTQSSTGLCNFPTSVGRQHRAFREREFLTPLLEELRARDIEAYAYYCVIFNNQAYRDHPAWRCVPRPWLMDRDFHGPRYGLVCLSNPEYSAFVLTQTTEILERYAFDGVFFDMTFWPGVCLCPACEARHLEETGRVIPQTIDWHSPDWCRFQDLRERWLEQFASTLSGTAKKLRPGIPVFGNFAMGLGDWTYGMSHDLPDGQDFLGGDYYGDTADQLLVGGLMQGLSRTRPYEFMTTVAEGLTHHVSQKSPERLELLTLSSIASSAALRLIDAVDPRGTLNPATYELIGSLYSKMQEYEPYLGGDPVEEAVVYLSDYSKMNLAENGLSVTNGSLGFAPPPHVLAARGALVSLQKEHLPFGVITRRELGRLAEFPLIVLPAACRMSLEEVKAFRDYVRGGGALYASGNSSLLETDGTRHEDFLLGEVFGCRAQGELRGANCYLRPLASELAESIAPQRYLSLQPEPKGWPGIVALAENPCGRVLATLTLPYAYPEEGSVEDERWCSIHSDPPWKDTATPLLVMNRFGRGLAVYSAADLESRGHWSCQNVFTALARMLLQGRALRFTAQARSETRITAFHQPGEERYLIHVLAPLVPETAAIRFRLPEGRRPHSLTLAPSGQQLEFQVNPEGFVVIEVHMVSRLATLCLRYA